MVYDPLGFDADVTGAALSPGNPPEAGLGTLNILAQISWDFLSLYSIEIRYVKVAGRKRQARPPQVSLWLQ